MAATAFALESDVFSSLVMTSTGLAAGDVVTTHNVIGVIVEDAATGDDAVLVYKADKIRVPKSTDSSEGVFSVGDSVYYDASPGEFNNASGGNTRCGIALEAATAADETVLIHLDGMQFK